MSKKPVDARDTFGGHVILYAKGHYGPRKDSLEDLCKLIEAYSNVASTKEQVFFHTISTTWPVVRDLLGYNFLSDLVKDIFIYISEPEEEASKGWHFPFGVFHPETTYKRFLDSFLSHVACIPVLDGWPGEGPGKPLILLPETMEEGKKILAIEGEILNGSTPQIE